MKKPFLLTTALFATLFTLAQKEENISSITARIEDEGKQLYRSEMASWYGTDLFLEKFKDREKIGGYFSYTEGSNAKCIFFGKGDAPKVIGTITFDSTYNTQAANANLTERDFTTDEQTLYTIRAKALASLEGDTLFKYYKNTNYNFIPFLYNGQRKVYILTGPTQNGMVVFGNDYLITFNEQNELISKKQLHRNIIIIDYSKDKEKGLKEVTSMHNHQPETGEFITPTDICTLMLYEKFANWEHHIVVSEHYMNSWNCKTNQLLVLTREAWEKIFKDQESRRKKN